MFITVLAFPIRVYRALPWRPHCNVSAGQHVALCRWLHLPNSGTATGYGMMGTAALKPFFWQH